MVRSTIRTNVTKCTTAHENVSDSIIDVLFDEIFSTGGSIYKEKIEKRKQTLKLDVEYTTSWYRDETEPFYDRTRFVSSA